MHSGSQPQVAGNSNSSLWGDSLQALLRRPVFPTATDKDAHTPNKSLPFSPHRQSVLNSTKAAMMCTASMLLTRTSNLSADFADLLRQGRRLRARDRPVPRRTENTHHRKQRIWRGNLSGSTRLQNEDHPRGRTLRHFPR